MTATLHRERDRDGNLAVQCSLLSDVIEDTPMTFRSIAGQFGEAMAAGVLALSKDQAPAKPRQLADSLQRIKQQPREIWMVKLADRITNLQPPPSYWTTEKIRGYKAEAEEILSALAEASDWLASRLQEKITAYAAYF